ncbi:MAG: hypothetical protein E6J77_28520 [Deltaproteobacteria bacterium]|nr:MAG: hypothetical protein E6J77_28520 [Deltaproteobacteria bacterium]
MRSKSLTRSLGVLALAGLVVVLVPAAAPAGWTDFEEKITVEGNVPIGLGGVWFLVAQTHLAEGRYRTFPELLRVSQGNHAGLGIHLLDVSLPEKIAEAVKTANKQFTPWTPSAAELTALARRWSKLPRAPKKDPTTDLLLGQVLFTVAAPERFEQVFPRQDEALKHVLTDSAVSLQIVENYRPLPVPPQPSGVVITQVMERKSIYGVKKVSSAVLEGDHVTGFIAAGPGFPIPLNFRGTFRMYCLTSCSRGTVAPTKTTRPRPPGQGRGRT